MQVDVSRVTISVQTRSQLDAALDRAVNLLKPAATKQRAGISVTRLTPGRYEASLDRDVPTGATVERWAVLTDPR